MPNFDIYSIKFHEVYPEIDLSEYFAFIEENRLLTKIPHETADHHILPKWAFPEYKSFVKHPWNKSILHHKNHLKAHILLWKAWNHINNTSPILLMLTNKLKVNFSSCDIVHILPLYQQACEEHARNTSIIWKGKPKNRESVEKMVETRRQNGNDMKGKVNCIFIETGQNVTVTSEEYKTNRHLYKSHIEGHIPHNKGVKSPSGKLTVYDKETHIKVQITSSEYNLNKEKYTHPGIGKTGHDNAVSVLIKGTDKTTSITSEEYQANKELYISTTSNKRWYNNGKDNLRLSDDSEIPYGFVLGRTTENLKGVKKKITKCPHCGKEGGSGNMKRYHFDFCHSKQSVP